MQAKLKCKQCEANFLVCDDEVLGHSDMPLVCLSCKCVLDEKTIESLKRAFASIDAHTHPAQKGQTEFT